MTETTDGSLLFVVDVGSNLSPTDCPNNGGTFGADCPSIHVFSATPGSTTLTPASVFSLKRMPTALSAINFTPPDGSSQTLLFVTSKQDFLTDNSNELSVYTVDSSGTLDETLDSPYTTQAPNPVSVQAVNTVVAGQTIGGVFVYVGAQGSGSGTVSAFQVCTVVGSQGSGQYSCTPGQVANSQLIAIGQPVSAGNDPAAMIVDPTNSFLYVAASGSNQVFGYSISTVNGTLGRLTPASVPSQGTSPFALVMHSSSTSNQNNGLNFLYVSNTGASNGSGSGNIGIFSAGVTSGSLSTSSNNYLFTDGQPSAMAAK